MLWPFRLTRGTLLCYFRAADSNTFDPKHEGPEDSEPDWALPGIIRVEPLLAVKHTGGRVESPVARLRIPFLILKELAIPFF